MNSGILILGLVALGILAIWLLNRRDSAQLAYDRGEGHRGTLDRNASISYHNTYKQRYKARAYDKGFNALQKAHDKQEAIDSRNRDRARKKGIIK